ncbi:MAG TPA: HAMP domain-containing sensor histidine kinase [Pyrinomonadaceae bacterium]|jgi:signal transduction histidine kinase|nr:HAMP domain-containing sensor histidine kinase [Pyrinomonadaceae bacterium]
MSEQLTDKVIAEVIGDKNALISCLSEIWALSDEIVDLFYTQIFSQSNIRTPAAVCKTFSEIIQRYWGLCCIAIYLRGEDGRLHEIAISTDEYVDEEKAHEVGGRLVADVEEHGREVQVWVDQQEPGEGEHASRLRAAFKEAHLSAGVTVPIHAQGELVGALAVVTPFPEKLHRALNGIRFIAAPIVIAVGNARRTAAMREQHHRIEHLVEELQQRSHDLEEANRELRRVAHYRSLFLARMSHELRTPLTSILGFSEILIDQEKMTDTQKRFCEKIQSSGKQLQMSLNQLVDLSRLEAGQSELFLHEFSLREALRESCTAVARLAHKQNVKIDCHPSSDLSSIVSDEGKLRQVLYNFLSHAISRSPEESSVIVRSETLAPTRFQIIIEDEGEALTDMSRIFEPIDICAPSENAASMNELGLVIARRLIDVLGGSVTLDSPDPRGLKVKIELPTRPTEKE